MIKIKELVSMSYSSFFIKLLNLHAYISKNYNFQGQREREGKKVLASSQNVVNLHDQQVIYV